MPFVWDDSFKLDIEVIDRQHKGLVDLVAGLFEAMKAGKAGEIIESSLEGLASYTRIHFKTEEYYFDEFHYYDSEGHKKEHADFKARIAEFRKSLAQGSDTLTVEMLNYLSSWLTNHIKGTDKRYVSYFHAHGLR
ncbi:MAG TPA: bacteriohemerythrin [Rectinemataceae bacterium]|nr:bacteriohemerythrin [Rectinemataceae bacterium]